MSVVHTALGYLATAYCAFGGYCEAVQLGALGFQVEMVSSTQSSASGAFESTNEINKSASMAMQSFMGEINMADYEGGLPIKTVRDNDAAVKLVDGASGATATKKLTVAQDGDAIVAGTNDFGIPLLGKDGTGDLVILPVPLPITDNGGAITVDASDLDIRDLAYATDSVTVYQGTDPWVIGDGGGSITVDASDLDIRDLSHASDSVKIGDGTDLLAVNADGSINANISDNGGSITVDASDLDIRDLDATQDNIAISDGTDTLAVNADGSINVVTIPPAHTHVCDYQTSATVGVGSTVNHDYVITNTKTISEIHVLVGARGATKIAVGTWNGSAFTVKAVYFQQVQGNIDHYFPGLTALGDGTLAIRIAITNLDGSSSDVYSSLNAQEA